MISYRCPSCQSSFQSPPADAGLKVHCGVCGQKIQIPNPRLARTILAPLETDAPVVIPRVEPLGAPPRAAAQPAAPTAALVPDAIGGVLCRHCGHREKPAWESKPSTGGWVVFGVAVLFAVGLVYTIVGSLIALWVGERALDNLRDRYPVCRGCGIEIH